MATLPGSNNNPSIIDGGGNYQPLHILKWLICHTKICDDVTTTNEDIRKLFVEQNPNYEPYRLSPTIGRLLNIAHYGNLQKKKINGKRAYNIQVFDDAIFDIIIRGG